jgi:Xaa-Pro aminopeptidase
VAGTVGSKSLPSTVRLMRFAVPSNMGPKVGCQRHGVRNPRQRAQDLMEQERLDGLVLIQPESIVYAIGARPGSAAGWRRAGAVFVIVPADARQPLTAIVGDFYAEEFRTASGIDNIVTFPVWVDLIDIREIHNGELTERLSAARPSAQVHPRPATFDRRQTFALLANVLARRAFPRRGSEPSMPFFQSRIMLVSKRLAPTCGGRTRLRLSAACE